MELGLAGKVALIPASSSGLGRAVALGFAREGAKLAICSRRQDAIDAVADEARALGAGVVAFEADLSKAEDIDRVVAGTIEHYGGVDVLILNAGGPVPGVFDSLSDDDWKNAFDLTLMSAVRLIRGCLGSMRERGGGSIVSMSSSSIKQPIPNLLLSNALRSAVAGLMKTIADEVVDDNIRINTVLPGRIRTPRIEQLDQANAERAGESVNVITQRSTAAIPMGRYGEPEEFANAVIFVASESASYITGTTIQVDGGAIRSLW